MSESQENRLIHHEKGLTCTIDELLPDEAIETEISTLGPARIRSPYWERLIHFVRDDERVLAHVSYDAVKQALLQGKEPLSFEFAGPREYIYFDPSKVKAAIVTCGGLCPGINDVIRAIVMALHYGYGVNTILGIRYGFRGFVPEYGLPFMELTPQGVEKIHELGGTILGSSRGPQPMDVIVDTLERMNCSVLFIIGGDGTFRAGQKIVKEIERRGLKIAVIAVPKTIDNDIYLVSKTFGFDTAVEMACQAIRSAHTEAVGAPNCIGLVKVMGRHSGFIAAAATAALREVNYCLIPESDFDLDGEAGLLNVLRRRIEARGHAVIVVAEGAGQRYVMGDDVEKDPSGNIKLGDIGAFLKQRIKEYFDSIDMDCFIRYIDPSYIVRSVPANVDDRLYCATLGQNAVHAAMAGKTGMLVSLWNDRYVHIPLASAIKKRKQVDLCGRLWLSVLESTGQPGLRN